MKSACRQSVAALILLCCTDAFAAPYPTEDQLRSAIAAVAGLLHAEGLESLILDARKEGLTQPLLAAGLNLANGVCLIYYNSTPEDGLDQFFAALEENDLTVMLRAMAVHEVAHCVEQREGYVRERFDKVLPPGFERGPVTVAGYLSVVKSGALETWGEALADIASVLYLKQTVPHGWKPLAQSLAVMRRELAWKWPEHDTSVWLDQIIAGDTGSGADYSLFESAFLLRNRYRPGE